jgi:hypothetical protein
VFNKTSSEIAVQFAQPTAAAARISFSVQAATTKAEGAYQTTMVVEASSDGSAYTSIGIVENQTKLSSSRQTFSLPISTAHVRLRMTNRVDANLLVDAVIASAAPEVVSFTPEGGGAGTTVIITGGNFLGATEVTFGGVAATFIVDSESQITAQVPVGAPVGKIGVTTAEGTGVSITDFVVPAPVITTDFSPKEGGAGTLVTINGEYFSGADTVTFNGVVGTELTVVSDTQLTVKVPAGASTGRIKVSTPAGEGTSITDFTVLAPTFTNSSPFSPATGGAGAVITIAGQYFSGVTSVTFNGVAATFTEISDTEVQATVPVNAGDGVVSLTTPAGTATSVDAFNFIDAPVITGFSPTAGEEEVTIVTIKGQYLDNITQVLFADNVPADISGLTLTTDEATGEQSFTVTVPAGAVTGVISLTNPGGTATTASAFTVYKAPAITAFTPTTGRPGDVLTITGTGFTGVDAVTFVGTADAGDDVAATVFTVVSDTVLNVTVPVGAKTGQLAVRNPVATATTDSLTPSDFTVDTTPSIISFEPTITYKGDTLTITGQNLEGVTTVTFFEGVAVGVTGATITTDANGIQSFNVTVPEGAATGPITLATPAGTATSTTNLTIITAPAVTSFSPTEGRAGDTFTITGTGFSGVSAVTVGGGNVTYEFVSDTQINATLTADAVTGKVAVTNVAGTGNSTADFTVLTTPLITSFTPTEGPVGKAVIINGKLLSQITGVTFGASAATAPTSVSDTLVVVNVPVDATTGTITVTGANGTATSTEQFRVIQAPQIADFTPKSGPVGTVVTITGSNFTDIDSVQFNGLDAASYTVAADGLSITATVPVGAASGFITVTNPAGTATSAVVFEVPAPRVETLSKTEGFVGDPVTITGEFFTGATSVTFNGVEAASYTVVNDTEITAYPPVDAGEGVVGVTTASGTGTSVATFKVLSPEITDIYVGASDNTVNEGYIGTEVTIIGRYFTGATTVKFNGATAGGFTLISDTEIRATSPFNPGTGVLSVTTPSGTGESTENFKPLVPEQITFSPSSGRVGDDVTVTGVYFNDLTSINFNGGVVDMSTVTQSTPTGTQSLSYTFAIPEGAKSGNITVTSTTGTGTSAEPFTVLSPDILTITPIEGRVGMTTVAINGQYFEQATEVRFMGGSGTSDDVVLLPGSFTIVDDNNITVVVPPGAKTGPISVTTPSGTDASPTFTLLVPEFTSFDPAAAVGAKVNQDVTIYGNYFLDATSVTFKGASGPVAATFSVISDTQINVVVPDGAITGQVSITTPSGTGTSADSYKIIPEIYSFDPQIGPFGTEVTITGMSLTGASVTFAGKDGARVAATNITLNTNTEVRVVVPTGARTGLIELTTAGGMVATATNFEVTSPIIDELTPAEGKVGSTFMITGVNLRDVGKVVFGNGVETSQFLESADGTSVEVVVPKGAATGPITVHTLAGPPATSAQTFTVIVPVITIQAALAEFKANVGEESAPQQYTVSATELEADINVTAPRANFLISATETGTYTTSLTIPKGEGTTVTDYPIWVIYKPSTEDTHQGDITHSTLNAVTKTLTVRGSSVTPLPVELVSFKAVLHKQDVQLTWTTASEKDNAYFEVEMSEQGNAEFAKVGRVKSKAGNSSVATKYAYKHRLNGNGGIRYFRLKQVDLDGTFAYSIVVAVETRANAGLQVIVAPNPLNYNSKMFITAAESGKAAVTLHTMSGKRIYQKSVEVKEGQNEIQLPLYDQLQTGLYILTVELSGQRHQIKVVKQ